MDLLRKMAEKAYHQWLKPLWENDMRDAHWESFLEGYARGRADAMELPEVRVEELEEGKVYLATCGISSSLVCCRRIELDDDDISCLGECGCDDAEIAEIQSRKVLYHFGSECRSEASLYSSFRGPLPLGDLK